MDGQLAIQPHWWDILQHQELHPKIKSEPAFTVKWNTHVGILSSDWCCPPMKKSRAKEWELSDWGQTCSYFSFS